MFKKTLFERTLTNINVYFVELANDSNYGLVYKLPGIVEDLIIYSKRDLESMAVLKSLAPLKNVRSDLRALNNLIASRKNLAECRLMLNELLIKYVRVEFQDLT